MKLYIFNEPFTVAYGGSFCYAIAESVEQAKALASAAPVYKYGAPPNERFQHTNAIGEPIRVVDLPCAEIYIWSE